MRINFYADSGISGMECDKITKIWRPNEPKTLRMSSTRSAEMIRSMDSPVFFIRSWPESFFVDALLALAAQREREHAVFLILGKVLREHRARFAEPFLQRGAQLFFE